MLLFRFYQNKKYVEITHDFKSDELKSAVAGNERRFNMILNHKKKIVFSNLQELIEDFKRFQIIQTYERFFKGSSFLTRLYEINLTKFGDSPEKMASELEIRRLALTKEEGDPLKRDILLKMVNSLRYFKSYKRFNAELLFRYNAIKLMDTDKFHLEAEHYRYPTQKENYLQLDEHYWHMPDKQNGFFILKNGQRPSEAINSIFDGSHLVVLECHSWMLSIQYKALLDTVGAKNFDLLFARKPLIIADGMFLSGDFADDLKEILPYKFGLTPEELIPGDWLYLNNFSEYRMATLFDASKNGSGLHSMAMGDHKYRGFGLPKAMTESEIKHEFLEVYNEDFLADPIDLKEESIDSETMGLDANEQDIDPGDSVVICGHIDCPEREWASVECIYQGNGRYQCEKLKMQDATENEIVLALLEKYNALLPKRKTESDIDELNIFKSLKTNVRGIDFSHQRFDYLFQESLSTAIKNSPMLFSYDQDKKQPKSEPEFLFSPFN